MAHGVEGRFPFLDHRVFEQSVRVPPSGKLDDLREKVALRELAASLLPAEIVSRTKQPYRAPEVAPFFEYDAPEWVEERLSATALKATGIFDEQRVAGIVRRCRAGRATSLREGMALVGVLSTQVWHGQFCAAGTQTFSAETGLPEVYLDETEVV